VLVVLAIAAWGLARGHHSFGAFSLEREHILRGTVVEFSWTEPHTVTLLDVPGAGGSVTRWTLEGMGPGFLGRRNWSRYTLEPGDEIEAVIYRLKDGSAGGVIASVTLADGTKRIMFTRPPG
jgi:hypothetical protein